MRDDSQSFGMEFESEDGGKGMIVGLKGGLRLVELEMIEVMSKKLSNEWEWKKNAALWMLAMLMLMLVTRKEDGGWRAAGQVYITLAVPVETIRALNDEKMPHC